MVTYLVYVEYVCISMTQLLINYMLMKNLNYTLTKICINSTDNCSKIL